MKRLIPLLMAGVTALLIFIGTAGQSMTVGAAHAPDVAVQAMYSHVKTHDFAGAYDYVAKQSQTDLESFTRDINGKDGSLKTLSSVQKIDTRILNEGGDSASVRATTEWSSAVGAIYETRDLNVVKEDGAWKVVWPKDQRQNLPPQVIPVTFLRWDIVHRSAEDDWGAQDVAGPRMRIVSMNAVEKDGGVTVLGELENEDTVPGFASVGATLVGKNSDNLAEESSFDKISHTLLPKEVSPFRIDFPGVKLSQVKSVRMSPNYLLVPASADPVIAVLHQRLDTDANGRTVLRGELMNESGQVVNIPHVLATFYDDSGKVVWVADGYVDHALQPQIAEPFAVDLHNELAQGVHRFRVTVNQYSQNRRTD